MDLHDTDLFHICLARVGKIVKILYQINKLLGLENIDSNKYPGYCVLKKGV